MKKSKLILLLTTTLALILCVGSLLIVNVRNASANSSTSVDTSQNVVMDPKEAIQDKMYNAIDYYTKAKGTFIYGSDAIGDEFTVDYNIKTKDGAFSYVKVKSNKMSTESLYDQSKDEYQVVDNNGKKSITARTTENVNDTAKTLKAKDRIHKNGNGQEVFERRADTTYMGGLAETSLFPQDIAASFLGDYSKWNIVSENETINGLQAVLIEGQLSDYFQVKHHATKFKLWVHKDTGILLAMEEYDDNGNVKEFLKTKDIKLNDKVDNSKETLVIPSNYKKVGQ